MIFNPCKRPGFDSRTMQALFGFTSAARGKGEEKVAKSKRVLETGGIDPPTSHMLSERSTI